MTIIGSGNERTVKPRLEALWRVWKHPKIKRNGIGRMKSDAANLTRQDVRISLDNINRLALKALIDLGRKVSGDLMLNQKPQDLFELAPL